MPDTKALIAICLVPISLLSLLILATLALSALVVLCRGIGYVLGVECDHCDCDDYTHEEDEINRLNKWYKRS